MQKATTMNYKTKLLFLDVDGVILDSLEVGYKGTAEVFVSEGITPPTQEEYHRDFDAHSAIGFYRSRGVKISSEEIWKRFLAYYDSHDHLVFQEVPEVLRSLSNSGVRLYFVTFGRSEDRVGTMFKKYGISNLFEDGGFGYERKDEYIDQVLGDLDIKTVHAAMIGDQPSDIIDAYRAGLRLRIGVARNEVGRVKLEPHPHTHIIKSLTELYDIL